MSVRVTVSQARVPAVHGGSAPEHGQQCGSFPSKCVAARQESVNVGFVFFCVEMNLLSQTGGCQLVIRAVCSQKSGKRHGLRASELQTCRPSETNCSSCLDTLDIFGLVFRPSQKRGKVL
jgi:hypothetical protein